MISSYHLTGTGVPNYESRPSDSTTTTNQDSTINVEYTFPQPPEKIWRALTQPELIAAWLMPNDFCVEVGHVFKFHTKPAPGFDGIVHCKVLTVEPNRRLRYSWSGGSKEVDGYGHFLDTVVTWTLAQTSAGGTQLRLDHKGFTPADTFAYQAMGSGWRGKVAASLGQVLDEMD